MGTKLRPGELEPNWLGGEGSDRLSIRIYGYEFPHAEPASDWWDANWLRVQGRIETCDKSWKFADPCLTTAECESLIQWLRAFPAVEPLAFVEPLLSFEADSHHNQLIRVRLRGESFPHAKDREQQWNEGYELFLNIGEEQRERFILTLQHDLERFPQRS